MEAARRIGWIGDANDEDSHETGSLPLGSDSAYFLDLYARYRRDPGSVPSDWRLHFEAMDGGEPAKVGSLDAHAREIISAYRARGHLEAVLDPLGLVPRQPVASLDRARRFASANAAAKASCRLAGREESRQFVDIIRLLECVYCGPATLEAAYVEDETARDWIEDAFEAAVLGTQGVDDLEAATAAVALADAFDAFVKAKMPTKKRFGSEGSEASVVILGELLRLAAASGKSEIVIGGIHRGRLATLATVLGKPLAVLLAEIKGRDLTDGGPHFTGDIPYHLGHAADLDIDGVRMRISIAPHPSHLMTVAPVAMGLTRARQASAGNSVDGILMHTDASFSGQGLASELLQLSGLDGYSVGGTVHIVVNNQIGFTTLPSEGRTARYCTDAAKLIGAPVLHVNGEDPVALLVVARVAHAWRQRFGRDILIDMVCTRTNGHNELDEPRFTQPAQYAAIDARPSLRMRLEDRLAKTQPEAASRVAATVVAFRADLEAAYGVADTLKPNRQPPYQAGWDHIGPADESVLLEPVTTGIEPARLALLAEAITTIGPDIDPNPKVVRFYEERRASLLAEEGAINFATAEALAIASLLSEGRSVRMSGQDLVRGTFTQRHMRVHDVSGARSCVPLANAETNNARFAAINSPLSEYGVLGFEYGHSLGSTDALTIWEAQFGDFLNGAQIMLDQYIASAEAKWLLRSGLVMLLPHGLEGQGPDHSSARPERILQLCAGGNMIVANPTTPANLFHLLRRQMHAPWRKPLVVIAPKSLLRLKAAISAPRDFTGNTRFQTVIGDDLADASTVDRVVMCSGKVWYDLAAAAEVAGIRQRVALIRIEQLFPFDSEALLSALGSVKAGGDFIWCQEEPENQGAWLHVRESLSRASPELASRLRYVGRGALPVAAGGSIERHQIEQRALVADALGVTRIGVR